MSADEHQQQQPDADETTAILKTFREQLYAEEIIHDDDSIGTDDETLL